MRRPANSQNPLPGLPSKEQTQSFVRSLVALFAGAIIGVLGGLIGLGGAEFRLPLLVGWFGLPILLSVLVNLLISLVTVTCSLLFRLPLQSGLLWISHWRVVANLLVGSLLGSALGARLAGTITAQKLKGIVASLLVLLGTLLIGHEWLFAQRPLGIDLLLRSILGVLAGLVIGIVSSLLGVAGGELLIPTLTLLFAIEIKLAGSLSLLVSLPTILMGLWRYSRQTVFAQLTSQVHLVVWMALGSVLGAFLGSQMLPYAPSELLRIFLGCILLFSAYRIWRSHSN